MEFVEATSSIRSLLHLASALGGAEASTDSADQLIAIFKEASGAIDESRRKEAVGNLLRVIAATLDAAQNEKQGTITGQHVAAAQKKICPVFPFPL